MTTEDTRVAPTAKQLWDALQGARTGGLPATLAHVEDALFRHYLPMARSIAAGYAADHPDPDDLGQAAEVGLTQAILGWRHRGPGGFDRFAGTTITARLRLRTFPAAEPGAPDSGSRPPPAGTPIYPDRAPRIPGVEVPPNPLGVRHLRRARGGPITEGGRDAAPADPAAT